jgi:hypothetical protein
MYLFIDLSIYYPIVFIENLRKGLYFMPTNRLSVRHTEVPVKWSWYRYFNVEFSLIAIKRCPDRSRSNTVYIVISVNVKPSYANPPALKFRWTRASEGKLIRTRGFSGQTIKNPVA